MCREFQLSDMLYLYFLPSMTGAHFVAGVTEYEESDKNERRKKYDNQCEALFMGHIVTGFFYPFFDFPFRAVPHLII